jgi:hypothetical protein
LFLTLPTILSTGQIFNASSGHDFSAQWGISPHFIIFGMRSPLTDRMATSIGAVGGLFQSGAKFGATEFGALQSDFNF